MKKKKILILGASRYYSKGIEAAKRAGYYIIAADKNPHADGLSAADSGVVCDIVDKEAVLKLSKKLGIDGIVPVNDYAVPTAAFVASKLVLPGISEEAACLATNKEEMRKRWASCAIPGPVFMIAHTSGECKEAIQRIGFPCILKPAHGIGGASRGVIVVRCEAEIDEAIAFSQGFYEDKTTIVESFIEAENEHSVEVIIADRIPNVIAVSDKIKTALPYRVDKNVLYPSVLTGEQLDNLKKHVADAVSALGITVGAAHVELASTVDGFQFFELGARCGGGGTADPIVPFVSGVEEFVETVRLLSGDPPLNLRPTRNYACDYHFLTPFPGTIKSVRGLEEVLNMPGVLDAAISFKAGDIIKPATVGGFRAGFIIAGASSRDEAYAIGMEAESKIRFDYR